MPKLSVIIINYGTAAMTEKVMRNFVAQERRNDYEFILVDNRSREALDENNFRGLPVRIIKNQENLGFARAVNQGLAAAQGEYILLLNSDVFIKEKSISLLLGYLENHPKAGLIGPRMLFPNGKIQPSAGRFPSLRREFLRLFRLYNIFSASTLLSRAEISENLPREVDWLSGGCLLFRASLSKETHGLDENFFLGAEDMDICFHAHTLGYASVFYPQAEVYHNHGFSSGGTRTIARVRMDREGIMYFMKKNYPKSLYSRIAIHFFHDLKIFYLKLAAVVRDLQSVITLDTARLKPIDATIAITYRCNARCQMCGIWQKSEPAALSVSAFENLSPQTRYINLTGGEPFLHQDLVEIVRTVKRVSPKAQIIISTNGLATDLITGKMAEVLRVDKRVGVRISLDGLKEQHDKIRGISGMYDAAIKTVDTLKALGVKNLGLSFTLMDENTHELRNVYDLSKRLGVELALAMVQNSDIYFTKSDNEMTRLAEAKKSLEYVIRKELKSLNPKHWARAYYDYGILHYAETGERLLKSGAGFDSLFVDPLGNIYPSNLIDLPMGNLYSGKLDDAWRAAPATAVRRKILSENIRESWIICTIRGEMRRSAIPVLWWIFRKKFF